MVLEEKVIDKNFSIMLKEDLKKILKKADYDDKMKSIMKKINSIKGIFNTKVQEIFLKKIEKYIHHQAMLF